MAYVLFGPSSDRSGGVRRSPDHQEFGHRPAISQQDANHLAWLSILSLLSGLVIAGAALRFGSGPESRQRFTAKTLSSRSR